MKDELFADLLASAEEMVRIEKGEQTPKVHHVHTFSEVDVKAIREATGLKQQDFAAAVGFEEFELDSNHAVFAQWVVDFSA